MAEKWAMMVAPEVRELIAVLACEQLDPVGMGAWRAAVKMSQHCAPLSGCTPVAVEHHHACRLAEVDLPPGCP